MQVVIVNFLAVKTKNVKEYVKWMMYWIIFALFTTAETFTDLFLPWFPFYYELKIAFIVWLLSPYTKGASVLYRKFVHPTLSSKEQEIDEYLSQAKDRSYEAVVQFGRRGLNVAASAAVTAAAKGQGALSERLRSFSMQDLTSIRGEDGPTTRIGSAHAPTQSAPRHITETIDNSGKLGNLHGDTQMRSGTRASQIPGLKKRRKNLQFYFNRNLTSNHCHTAAYTATTGGSHFEHKARSCRHQ
uniref:Receptor expression-enhancing protein n=1 Tax=Callorhinchus milii TaxID=7868 RepID=A0A4W3IJK6_CALMI